MTTEQKLKHLNLHVGEDGAWVELKTKSGKSFCFQPMQEFGSESHWRQCVLEWAREVQCYALKSETLERRKLPKSTGSFKSRLPLRTVQLWKLSQEQLQKAKKAQKLLTYFQDSVWHSLGKYSDRLGWGLTGLQAECWTLLDRAVEELAELRKRYRIVWGQNMGGGRGVTMELAGDYDSVRLVWAKLNKDQTQGVRVVHQKQEQTLVRDIHVYRGCTEFDPKQPWPRKPRILA